MKKIITFCFVLLCGCVTLNNLGDKGSTTPANSVAIIVALTKVDYNAYSGWDGRCAGSNTDLERMYKTCREAGIERVTTLYNERATTFAVLKQVMMASKALEPSAKNGKSPLMVFYYSGHGGAAYDYYRIEKDSMHQTMCLWDGQMVDDLLWDALRKVPKGIRVVHITDTCNSGTNYRNVPRTLAKEYKDKYFRPRITRRLPEELSCDFIHFGGCDDGETSKGNVTYGGIFTYTLIETVKPDGKNYYQWFEGAKSAMPKIGQIPVMSVIQSEESIFNNGRIEERPALK